MTSPLPAPARDVGTEISALITILHDTGQRLEQLTHGEVDAVADRQGRTFLLRHAQEHLRRHEADKQAAVLNALPANIALIDVSGTIVSVNAGWRLFADANVLHAADHGVGANYLAICDNARGDDAPTARAVAEGIRSVLQRRASSFGSEYPCHSPSQQRWFLMTVTPLGDERAAGAVVMHLDITERVQAEQALGLQRSELRALFDMLPAMIWFKDTNNRILRVNQKVADAAGLPVAGIEGRCATEIYPAEAARLYADDLEIIASATAKLGIVEAMADPHGTPRWIQTDKVPCFDSEGAVVGVAVMARDVTEQKTAADVVKRSERHLRDIFNGIGSSMFVALLARDGILLEVNQASIEAGGLRLQDVLGKPFDETPWWSAPAHTGARLRSAMVAAANGEASRFDVQTHLPGRQAMEWDFSLQPLRDEGGRVAYLVASANDITERKRSELKLRESQRRFSDLLENVQLVSVMLDDQARITYCNEYLLSLTGWRLEAVIGRNWFDIFVPIELGDLRPAWKALLENDPDSRHREAELLTRTGERRLVRWNNSVLRSGTGEVIGTASIGEDITERAEAEAVLAKHTAELERFHRLSVGRELQMIELKKQINEMAHQAGQTLPYNLAFLDPHRADADHARSK